MKQRPPRATRAEDSATRFLNVDLDVFASVPLERLAVVLGARALVLHVGRHGRTYRAHFELRRQHASADRTIRELVALLRRLPRPSRALWNRADRRDFNIGIQGGRHPHSYEIGLQPATLQLISSVNARLVITVYAEHVRGEGS
jgi:hypothetical protein